MHLLKYGLSQSRPWMMMMMMVKIKMVQSRGRGVVEGAVNDLETGGVGRRVFFGKVKRGDVKCGGG